MNELGKSTLKKYEKFLIDKILLDTYMNGFFDGLNGVEHWNPNSLLMRAYKLGYNDAIAGDDVMSLDFQTNEEILNRIHNEE